MSWLLWDHNFVLDIKSEFAVIISFSFSHRVCYRTTVDLCDTQYRLYLNRRNFNGLLKNCPNETEHLHASQSEVIFPSPRYQCQKKNGRIYRYRNKELCLYNISVPNCGSGRVFIQQVENKPQELEDRLEINDECVDYLQFFYDSSEGNSVKRTNRFCGTELNEQSHIPLPTTNFLALFWTDTLHNSVGFDLRAICQPTENGTNPESGSGDMNVPIVKWPNSMCAFFVSKVCRENLLISAKPDARVYLKHRYV